MNDERESVGPAIESEITIERKYDLAPVESAKEIAVRRPTKFTEETKKKILTVLKLGHDPSTAAAYAGITEKTLLNWWNRGQLAGSEAESVDLELYEFAQDCVKARATSEVGLVSIIWKHAKEDGNVAIKFLEKLFPEKFGKVTKHQVTGKVEHTHKKVDYSHLSDEELEQAEQIAMKLKREQLKEEVIDAEIIE